MLQIFTDRVKKIYGLFDLRGTGMPSAGEADGRDVVCLRKTGSGECLEPGPFAPAKG
jgi:hypothetical protein